MNKKKTKKQLNKYLQKEILKAKKLGLNLYPIYPNILISNSKNTFGYCKYIGNRSEIKECRIYLSSFTRKLKKKEIKSIIMHEVLHTVIDSKGHDNIWKNNCVLVRENYSYNGYEKYHLHPKPYSKNRAKKCYISGVFS